MKSIGFKEWSLVCDALGRGEQSIILRKGGITEGRGGFSFRHHQFFLFPTFFHEQIGKVRSGAIPLPEMDGSEVAISLYAKLEQAVRIDSMETAEALAPLHVLTPEVVRERFGYNGEGLNVAFLRVFRLEREWVFPNEKRFGGCRSWVELPEAPESAMKAVIDEAVVARQRAQFENIISLEKKV